MLPRLTGAGDELAQLASGSIDVTEAITHIIRVRGLSIVEGIGRHACQEAARAYRRWSRRWSRAVFFHQCGVGVARDLEVAVRVTRVSLRVRQEVGEGGGHRRGRVSTAHNAARAVREGAA